MESQQSCRQSNSILQQQQQQQANSTSDTILAHYNDGDLSILVKELLFVVY